ncbi:hypothetical protein Pcinc_042228 [Petrolisthes cinctipes]|uniref:Uncharacterized protein n=1 Tax=Petrolisthes cinctipes TaxID=88211 RepID=A0AAE1EG65_PETCI|nr:hypothetical protein Pcinc_042228 [Petrolisthes cinctipes]
MNAALVMRIGLLQVAMTVVFYRRLSSRLDQTPLLPTGTEKGEGEEQQPATTFRPLRLPPSTILQSGPLTLAQAPLRRVRPSKLRQCSVKRGRDRRYTQSVPGIISQSVLCLCVFLTGLCSDLGVAVLLGGRRDN